MGFTFRKSVKIGPVRLNVSKSGVGVSAGVKGARVGVNAKGKAYASVGAKGLRYQTQLGSAKREKNDETSGGEELPNTPVNAGGVFGGLVMVFSFFACFVNVEVGIIGLCMGLVAIIFSGVYSKRKNENRRIRIIQDSQLSEDALVQLLAEYCFWKKISGDEAKQTIQSMLQERASFLEQEGAEK